MNKAEFLLQKKDKIGLLMKARKDNVNIYIEGIDDYEFYRKFFPNEKLIQCGNKNKVLEVNNIYRKIRNNMPSCIFFIDKDFSTHGMIDYLFETNYYNFESHIYEISNVIKYLKSKFDFKEKSLEIISEFYFSDSIRKILHADYIRVKNKEPSNYSVGVFDVKNNFDIEISNLNLKKRVEDILPTEDFYDVTFYNGKNVAAILNTLFQSSEFCNIETNINSSIKDRVKLTNSLIIELPDPEYIKMAKEFISLNF